MLKWRTLNFNLHYLLFNVRYSSSTQKFGLTNLADQFNEIVSQNLHVLLCRRVPRRCVLVPLCLRVKNAPGWPDEVGELNIFLPASIYDKTFTSSTCRHHTVHTRSVIRFRSGNKMEFRPTKGLRFPNQQQGSSKTAHPEHSGHHLQWVIAHTSRHI